MHSQPGIDDTSQFLETLHSTNFRQNFPAENPDELALVDPHLMQLDLFEAEIDIRLEPADMLRQVGRDQNALMHIVRLNVPGRRVEILRRTELPIYIAADRIVSPLREGAV